MPRKHHAHPLMADVMWRPDREKPYVHDPDEPQLLDMPKQVVWYYNDIALALDDVEIEMTPELHEKAMKAAYARYERDCERKDRKPEPPRPRNTLPTPHNAIVYYMRLGDLVKIGTTTNIVMRVEALNPQGVMAVEWGGYDLELARHRQFVQWHHHGEWYRLCPEIGAHIADVRATFEAEAGVSTETWINTQSRHA